MLTLLHISDLHFGEPFVPHVGEALLTKLGQLPADAIVISGDLTQRAKPREFRAARDYFERLPPLPRVIVPGNHDVPLYRMHERLLQPYRLYRKYIADELDTVLRLDNAVIVALDSTNPYRTVSNGRIRTEQLEFCERALTDAPADAARIVVAHHHFAPAPDYDGGEVMPKGKRALDWFTRLRVDLILAGHLHRAYVGNSLDVYSGEDREHGIVIVQCGTSTSRRGRAREREKNSFNWIQLSETSVSVLHYMYFDDFHDFRPVSRYEMARAARRYLPDVPGAAGAVPE